MEQYQSQCDCVKLAVGTNVLAMILYRIKCSVLPWLLTPTLTTSIIISIDNAVIMGVTITQAGDNLQQLTAKFQALQAPAQSITSELTTAGFELRL